MQVRVTGPSTELAGGPHTDMHPDLLTIEQAAQLVDVSTEQMYRLARRGELPGARKLGNLWRVSRIELFRALGVEPDGNAA